MVSSKATLPLNVLYAKMVYPRTKGVPIATMVGIIPKDREGELYSNKNFSVHIQPFCSLNEWSNRR